jgi:hypothetical protein
LDANTFRSGGPLAPACTVIIKATYPLLGEPGRAAIESMLSGDVSREIDGEDEPHYASDFVPYKPCGEFMIRGTAVRSANAARERFQARVQVGSISKAIDVVGNRTWTKSFWRFRPGGIEAVDRVPLSYRFAHGGPGHPGNPIGRGFETEGMPNLEIPGKWIESRRSLAEPAGFGPLDAGWIQRRKRFGSPDAAWVKDHWPWLPPTFDFRFFNAAPADQWCEGYWRGDEELLFENMHPEQPLLRAALPGLRARAFMRQRMAVEGDGGERLVFREVPLALDTLWIDLESMNLVLVWRGITAVRSLKLTDVEDLFVLAERLAEPVHSLDHYAQLFAAQFSPAEDEAEASALDEVRDEIDAKLVAAAAAREEIRSKLSAAAAAEAAMLERAKPRTEQAFQEFEKAMAQVEPMIEKARKLAEEAGLGPDGKRQLSAAEQKAAFDGLRAQFAAVAGNPSLDPESAARLEQLRGQIDNIEAAVAGISEEMAAEPKPEAAKPRERATVKLSYKEQRELEALPATIEALETEQKQVNAELEDGTIYGRDPERAQKLAERHEAIELELLEALLHAFFGGERIGFAVSAKHGKSAVLRHQPLAVCDEAGSVRTVVLLERGDYGRQHTFDAVCIAHDFSGFAIETMASGG